MLTSFASKGAMIGLGAVGGAAGIAGGLLAAAKKSADLGESISKVRVIFGGAANGMLDQANELARKFGVVKQSALDAGAGFGLMGRAAGMSKEASSKLGQEMVQLGLDMASFHNITNEEAFEKLRSGLAGEAEPLRPLGILLSEDAVKAEALAMGLVKVKRELTDQEKVLARLSLIRKQAGPAVGDLERTADSNANQLRKLQGEMENAAVEFGDKLQAALKDGISLAHELGDAIMAATGKSAAENVGELVRASVNLGRTAVDGGAAGTAAMAGLSAASAIGSFALTDAAQSTIDRAMQDRVADAAGLSFTAPGIPALMTEAGAAQGKQEQAGRDLAAQQARSLQENALRDARDADRAEGRRLFGPPAAGEWAAGPGAVGGAPQTVAERQTDRLAVNDAGASLLGALGAGGSMLQGIVTGGLPGAMNQAAHEQRVEQNAETNRHNREVDEAEVRKSKRFDSQSFSGGGDFASFAISKALSDPEDDTKKQLDELKKVGTSIDGLKALGDSFLTMVNTAPPLRAILRGSS